jgi:hypothetical protein
MRPISKLLLTTMAGATLFVSGCAAGRSPVTGFWYTDVKSDAAVTSNTAGAKVGRAEAKSILGLVALGDCSTEAAAKSAGITKVSHVDYETWSLLGLYATTTTVVHGE